MRETGGLGRMAVEGLFQATAWGEVWAAHRGNRPLQLMTKPVAVPLLGLKAALRRGTLEPAQTRLLVSGLLAAGVGDYYMSRSDEDGQIVRGAAAFGAMQTLYSALLLRRGHRPHLRTAALPAALWAAAATLLAVRREPGRGAVPAVLASYAAVLAGTLTLAQDPGPADAPGPVTRLIRPGRDRRTWLPAGVALFAISDTAILLRRTLLTGARSRAAAQVFVLVSYNAAQWLIVEGFLAPPGRDGGSPTPHIR
ncbi:lysoplasmalogenase family protein [Streptomyces sp. NBC_01264]|uniref:lysoplasmalogenase family protein n=1 Tax=Streptomyces sp. NBC_01264 TaxID=2903804 RepID=UPI00225836A6|nr:lysoplasmalogenase family protein [Streptomyces sp. NBC_01264]MCX4781751.1 lysoplasmalogenase [Streptomyces sp. NBC_01264]